jgi:hypothetical protein
MRMEAIRRETRKLRKKFEEAPRILTFRGRKVVHVSDWSGVTGQSCLTNS